MPKPRVKVELYVAQKVARKVEQWAQRHDICFTAAFEKLIRAGAEALEERKEASDGTDRR